MTPRPPALAERVIVWSLAFADREAVLGDLQEEFAALAAASGTGAARRWYWTQTLTSVGPNVVRRIRGERRQRRVDESDSDRLMRKSVRTFGLWLIGVPLSLGLLGWGEEQDLSAIVGLGGPIAFIGLLLLAANVFPHRAVDAETMSLRLRRHRFFWTLVFLTSVLRLILYPAHRQLLRDVNWTLTPLGIAILLWPQRYWPIRPRKVPEETDPSTTG
jgi:hypothetical protein